MNQLPAAATFRINGGLTAEKDNILIAVKQANVNCPKYIQRRTVKQEAKPIYPNAITRGIALTEELVSWVKEADTFFVGSSNGQSDMDASHRGGNPGFVEVINSSVLRIPDYEGNSMYNTLGNFLVDPPAGLLFIHFKTHRTLQLTGKATVIWPENPGALLNKDINRFWVFLVEEWAVMENLKNFG